MASFPTDTSRHSDPATGQKGSNYTRRERHTYIYIHVANKHMYIAHYVHVQCIYVPKYILGKCIEECMLMRHNVWWVIFAVRLSLPTVYTHHVNMINEEGGSKLYILYIHVHVHTSPGLIV